MICVIQCAASKQPTAGHMVARDGRLVVFVADPQTAPPKPPRVYARPDDPAQGQKSWRQLLIEYNNDPGNNPLGLYPAFKLYKKVVYGRIVDHFGLSNVYILSAGWGLIRADFLTPCYDITFNHSAEHYKRRGKTDRYDDFRMLLSETEEHIVFFGGMDYLPLFSALTTGIHAPKTVFYNSASMPSVRGSKLRRFETSTRTNWHYECANAFIDGDIRI